MPPEIEKKIEICSPRHLAQLYLQFGSVEEALMKNPGLPISIADFHRKIKQYGIVKGVGRRKVSLAETLYFFASKVGEPNVPIEKLYKHMPWAIRESASIATIHRIYQKVCERMVRTYAAALVLTTSNPTEILVADEETQNLSIGKKTDSTSLLMSFGKKGEPFFDSVLRVMQREFSTKLTLAKELTRDSSLTKKIIPSNTEPFMYLHLLDVEIAVFHLSLPDDISENLTNIASSYKVNNHRFTSLQNILSEKDSNNFRPGVKEIVEGYQNYMFGIAPAIPLIKNSLINEDMLALSD